jgi:hypothetical protein
VQYGNVKNDFGHESFLFLFSAAFSGNELISPAETTI